MPRRVVTSVLQDWIQEGRRIGALNFNYLSGPMEFECVLVDRERTQRWRGQAPTLARAMELALLKAEAATGGPTAPTT